MTRLPVTVTITPLCYGTRLLYSFIPTPTVTVTITPLSLTHPDSSPDHRPTAPEQASKPTSPILDPAPRVRGRVRVRTICERRCGDRSRVDGVSDFEKLLKR